MQSRTDRGGRGFTLPIVMVAMTGLLVLLLGLITIVSLERQSSRAHADGYRAELAARSALSEVRSLLTELTADDAYVVLRSQVQVGYDDDEDGSVGGDENVERPYLFLARWGDGESGGRFSYEPMFSTEGSPEDTDFLELPDELGLPPDEVDRISLRALPFEEAPVLAWNYIENESGVPVARYAYWVEDMEAYVNASVAGNERGEEGAHRRVAELWPDDWDPDWPMPYPVKDDRFVSPWPVPGLNPGALEGEALLDQIALFTIEDGAKDDDTDFDNELFGVRRYARTTDSLLAALDVPSPLQRDKDGHLEDERGRRVEEALVLGNRSYFEQPLIPPLPGIDPSVVGEPQLNLNEVLAQGGSAAVGRIAGLIREAFPDFDSRKGGFGEDYISNLAANIIDYADVDGNATQQDDAYRGIDSYPLVSEYAISYRWGWRGDPYNDAGVLRENGRLYVLVTVSVYAELWNTSNHPARGEARLNYETKMSPEAGAVPGRTLMDDAILERPAGAIDPDQSESGADHTLEKDAEDGHWYFPPFTVNLDPNEYVLVKAGEVKYKLDAGLSIGFVASPLSLVNDHGQSGYRLKWNGILSDRVQGGIERSDVTVYFPRNTTSNPRQKTRATIGGYVFGEYGLLHDGMGDPRISYHTDFMQAANAYPRNYSPWRRNVRLAIFRNNQAAIYGRVMPSEWPDGGHDSSFGQDGYFTEDQRIEPDDARFISGKPASDPGKAPTRLSNLGVYYSETELGHIYDPIMWGADRNPLTGAALGRLAVQAWTPMVRDSDFPSQTMGGGNTLRIGRPEHPRFDEPGLRASSLLDLFHCGLPLWVGPFGGVPVDSGGPLVLREGHVNINTAPRDALRALVAGKLAADPVLARAISTRPSKALKAPPTIPMEGYPPQELVAADLLADAIIAGRPYLSPSQLALAEDRTGRVVFGNLDLYPGGKLLQWSDAALEESFARIYNSATVRSRNFRVHVIGQAVQEIGSDRIKVLSTRRKIYRVFSSPGERGEDGRIDPEELEIKVLYEKNR